MTSASRQRSPSAASASAVSSRSPLVATITGSTTSTGTGWARRYPVTVRVISAVPSMPIFTPSTVTSSNTASSCSVRKATSGVWMLRTPWVFWATRAVTTVIAKPPASETALMSAWMPAPPVGSVPAMDRMRGTVTQFS
jgi:hypothetical protein